jgi:hypothetical protein
VSGSQGERAELEARWERERAEKNKALLEKVRAWATFKPRAVWVAL